VAEKKKGQPKYFWVVGEWARPPVDAVVDFDAPVVVTDEATGQTLTVARGMRGIVEVPVGANTIAWKAGVRGAYLGADGAGLVKVLLPGGRVIRARLLVGWQLADSGLMPDPLSSERFRRFGGGEGGEGGRRESA
jgi:hypothetical protein